MSEVLIDLRRNVVPISVKVVVLALFFLIVATVASFATSVSSAISSAFSEETEVDLFGVVDTLTDPDAFYAFRQSTRSIQQLGAFYDGLNTSDDLTLLSAFDQQIPVQDFRGGDEFDPGYGNELSLTDEYVDATSGSVVEDVRAMQMNRQALEFYDIEVASGTSIDWGTVDYPGGKVPVLLGSAYEGVYQVGERLSGSLYLRPMEFEVVGILRQGSAMFYKGEMNTYLDSAMIVPYPESLTEIGSLDQEFLGILSFAMINADVASGGGTGFDGVADELRQISMRTGFEDYSLIGVPTYLIQFGLMRQLIVDNRGLLVVVLALLAGGWPARGRSSRCTCALGGVLLPVCCGRWGGASHVSFACSAGSGWSSTWQWGRCSLSGCPCFQGWAREPSWRLSRSWSSGSSWTGSSSTASSSERSSQFQEVGHDQARGYDQGLAGQERCATRPLRRARPGVP
ncbi:hypothetical protein [Oerskovia enterophila]|uniref:hypothetical protein n=1 Tax=Oerskovia enterophila TaxID=43678 RepID=UPI00382A5EB5